MEGICCVPHLPALEAGQGWTLNPGMCSAHLPRKFPHSLETSQESLPVLGVAGFQVTPIPGGLGTRENLGLNLGSDAYSQGDLGELPHLSPLGFLSAK